MAACNGKVRRSINTVYFYLEITLSDNTGKLHFTLNIYNNPSATDCIPLSGIFNVSVVDKNL
jgi:hypothetical protein